MATVQTRLMTAEEFYEWVNRPENRDRHWDLVRGEVVAMSKPGKRHGLVCGNVAWILGSYVRQRRRGYVCTNDTGLIVERSPDTVRGPDVLLFEDAQRFADVDVKFCESPPLLAVEVLSPNDTAGKVMERITDQLRFGTKLVWLLDPDAPNVTVFRPGKEPYALKENQELGGDEVLPNFSCRVSEFFSVPGEPSPAESGG
jgi:Uma2 family endonuclease